MVVCADFEPMVAVITADPADTPVTTPDDTVATADADVPHDTVRPESAPPDASSPAAVRVVVCPTAIAFVGALI